jgi:Uma2 family endonuclease
MALQHPQTMSVEEYFQLEENDPEHRYEYVDGYVYMMAGGTVNHE